MSTSPSFKTRVKNTVSQYAPGFETVFVNYEYLVCSPAFSANPYYIISASKDNYLHLTGIPYGDAQLFFDKCISGTLNENDISFTKKGKSENEIKGSIRRKINVLPNLINIFSVPLFAQESFSKNRIICSFGTTDGICTIGFTLASKDSLKVRPMTLLSGDVLNPANSFPVELILQRKSGEPLFNSVIYNVNDALLKYKDTIAPIVEYS